MPGSQDVRLNGPWDCDDIRVFLTDAIIPIRLAVLNGDGWPLIVSLWFTLDDDALWCATNENALIAQFLHRSEHCAFEIAGDAPPYRGVRGQGKASLHSDRGAEVLEGLLLRYSIQAESRLSRLLLAKANEEVAIRIEPEWMTSWDFTALSE